VTERTSEQVGMVLGTEDSTPLTFWVGVDPESYLQLDDTVLVQTPVPGHEPVRITGIVQDVRARHEGAQFDTDVFLVDRGVLPVDTAVAAQVVATRFEPEVFVPPMPGIPALRARGKDRDEALYFDQMQRRLPAGLTRDGEPVFLDLDFLDGSRGAHVNISGVSGVATKTTYALFLLYALFHSDALGAYGANTKAIVFNVKGEDLMWLDTPNARLTEDDREDYEHLGLRAGAFESVGLWAPIRPDSGGRAIPHVEGRSEGVTAYFWTIREFVRERFLRFMFAEAEDERSQIADLVARVEAQLDRECEDDPEHDATVRFSGYPVSDFAQLCDIVANEVDADGSPWRGRVSDATVSAFLRRLEQLELASRRLTAGRMKGERRSVRRGQSVEFADHRDYVPGDDFRFVDWNVYQRFGKLLVRLYEEEEDLGILFIVDASASMAFGDGRKLDQARRLVAALSYVGLANLDRVAITAVADGVVARLPPTRGKARIFKVFQFLREVEAGGSTDLGEALTKVVAQHKRRGLAVLVSDLYDPAGFERGINVLRYNKFEPYVLHVVDPADFRPKLRGDVHVYDVETGDEREVTVTEGLLGKLEAAHRDYLADIERFCAKNQVSYFRASVDEPFDQLVLQVFRRGGFLR